MNELKEKTQKILDLFDESLNWARGLDQSIGEGLESGIKHLRRPVKVIDAVLGKKPSIAIFGQSQVGKSYLINLLVKPKDQAHLLISFGEHEKPLDFINEINPYGEAESTGLVTRFTTKALSPDLTHPVKVELFGQLDIASILANGFLEDVEDYYESCFEFDADTFFKIFSELSTEIPTDIDEDDSYFFSSYIQNSFKESRLVEKLKDSNFFSQIESNLHRIKFEKRVEVLKYLWGQNEFLTRLFNEISAGVKTLNYNKDIRISIDSMIPRDSNIVNVETVKELYKSGAGLRDVNVKLDNGSTLYFNRSLLSLMVKEVELEINDKTTTNDIFDYSDVLDFPGSKSREMMDMKTFEENSEMEKMHIVLRGKVSYLFETFSRNLGVSTLLYCIHNSPIEEKGAPKRLYNWIKNYVGSDSSKREERLKIAKNLLSNSGVDASEVSPLLMVTTKFDIEMSKNELGQETNSASHDEKWVSRFRKNFIEEFTRTISDNWVLNWTKGTPKFKFVFPIRNPSFSDSIFDGLRSSGKETEVRSDYIPILEACGKSFVQNEFVNNHIISPREIWGELSSPNGTGVSYLSKHLKNCCHPSITKARIKYDLVKITKDFIDLLSPHGLSGNFDQDIAEAKKLGRIAYTTAVGLTNKQDNLLYKIFKDMRVSDTEIWNKIYQLKFGNSTLTDNEYLENENNEFFKNFEDLGVNINESSTYSSVWRELRTLYEGFDDDEIKGVILDGIGFDLDELSNLLSSKEESSINEIARVVISFWSKKISSATTDNDNFKRLSDKQQETFKILISQITQSLRVFEVDKILSENISRVTGGVIDIKDLDLVASCCSTILNEHLFSAGWSFSEEKRKPLRNKETKDVVFSEHTKFSDVNNLSYSKKNSDKRHFKEWIIGCQSLFEENVKYRHGIEKDVNSSQNQLLNKIINSAKSINSSES